MPRAAAMRAGCGAAPESTACTTGLFEVVLALMTAASSVDVEVVFEHDPLRDGRPVHLRRREPDQARGGDGLVRQPVGQTLDDGDVADAPVGGEHGAEPD